MLTRPRLTKLRCLGIFIALCAVVCCVYGIKRGRASMQPRVAASTQTLRSLQRAYGAQSKPDWRSFALILVDIQQDFCNKQIIGTNPDLVRNITELLAFARLEGIDVVHIRSEFDAAMKDWPAAFQLMFANGIPCTRGTEGAQPAAFARELAGERVFYKSNFDAFSNHEFLAYMRHTGKKHLLIAGLTTEVCVLSTALGAVNQGFVVSVVDDCCSAADPLVHKVVLIRYGGFIFDVVRHRTIPHRNKFWLEQLAKIQALSGARGS